MDEYEGPADQEEMRVSAGSSGSHQDDEAKSDGSIESQLEELKEEIEDCEDEGLIVVDDESMSWEDVDNLSETPAKPQVATKIEPRSYSKQSKQKESNDAKMPSLSDLTGTKEELFAKLN